MIIGAVFGVSLTEFFQNKDSILLSKALADMIESYKKLQITQSVCVSGLRITRLWIYSIMHTILTILYLPIIIIYVDIAISIVCEQLSKRGVKMYRDARLTISVCFHPSSANFVGSLLNQYNNS